ncbi:PQQ-binding-like beta-propeller repeat protein, partial [Actinomadura fibrosa]|uniref:PQQ-binding-like beta-propeller repeat protein n=1 Tax=Actinomadura fibrosa TaxID=111802 RepID=UPI0013F171B9
WGGPNRGGAAGLAAVAGAAVWATVRAVADATAPEEGTWTLDELPERPSGGPVVAGGLVFVTVGIGSNGSLVAIDRRTGRRRWLADGVRGPLSATTLQLAVSGGVVYACGESEIRALGLADGRERWSVPSSDDPVPVLASGLLIAPEAGSSVRSEALVAYDAATGAKRWTFDAGEGMSAAPAVSGTLAYVTGNQGQVYALDTATGQARWRAALGSERLFTTGMTATPVVGGGVLCVTDDSGAVHALDPATGRRRWTSEETTGRGGVFGAAVSVAGPTVYLADAGGNLRALRLGDGKVAWRHAFRKSGNSPRWLLPLVTGGLAICFADDTLVALDAASGRIRWESPGHPGIFQRPVLAAGAVHFGSLRDLTSHDLATGRHLRTVSRDAASNVTAAGDVLYWNGEEAVHAAKAR